MTTQTSFHAQTSLHAWPPRGLRLGAAALLALCALWAGAPALALDEGGDFAATVRYDKTADLPNAKQVTLSLRLFNFSGGDVAGATVLVHSALPPGDALGSIANVTLLDNTHVLLSGRITVPASDYQRWQDGAEPQLVIEYVDAGGNKVRRPIEVMQMPAGMGE